MILSRKNDNRHRPMQFSAVVLFFSGFSSLIYQVVWQRVLTQEVGVDAISIAITISIFMLGLGLGSLLGGFLTTRIDARLPLVYGLLEIALGIFGMVTIWLLRYANQIAAGMGWYSTVQSLFPNLVVLILPTLLMGMSLPFVLAFTITSSRSLGRGVGFLYGVNICGAALGAVLSGYFLIELVGLRSSATIAAIINIVIGLLVVCCRKIYSTGEGSLGNREADASRLRRPLVENWQYLLSALLLGFVTLSFEMVLFRVVSLHFASHVYVFPMMLACYLLLMSIGNGVAGGLLDRISPHRYFLFLIALLVSSTLILVLLFNSRSGPMFYSWNLPWQQRLLHQFFFTYLWLLPVLTLSGFFPAILKMMTTEDRDIGRNTGLVLGTFTLGNTLGSYLTSMYLFESFGTINVVRLGLVLATVAVLLIGYSEAKALSRFAKQSVYALAVVIAACIALPSDFYREFTGSQKLVEAREGVVTYFRGPKRGLVRIHGQGAAKVYINIELEKLRLHNSSSLMIFDPNFRPRKILVIGLGTARHAWSLPSYEFVEDITVIELSSNVVEFVSKHSAPEIQKGMKEPKFRVIVDDGRRWMQQAVRRGEKYDYILTSSHYPTAWGSANLYSLEFFETLKSGLRPGGYVGVMDSVGVIPTALAVFRNVFVLNGAPYEAFLTDSVISEASSRKIPSWLARAYTADTILELSENLLPDVLLEPVRMTRLDAADFQMHPLNSDDHPTLEYRFIRELRKRYVDADAHLVRLDEIPGKSIEISVAIE